MAEQRSIDRKHSDIRKMYDNLSSICEYGAKKYTSAFIINKIAYKFYMQPRTVGDIVYSSN